MYAASADAFDTVARGAGLAVRDDLARSLFLIRNTGTTLGVHARRAQTLQCIHPQADEIMICLREKNAELSDACRTAFEAGMKQPPNAGDSTQSPKHTTQ